jgi:hypothetical protein
MATATAVGYLELNITGFNKAVSDVKKGLVGLAGAFVGFKSVGLLTDQFKDASRFATEAFQNANKFGLKTTEQYVLLSEALKSAGLSGEEANKRIKKFSQDGRDFAELFASPEDFESAMKEAAKDLGSQGVILNDSAEDFQKTINVLGDVATKIRGFFLAILEQVTPAINAVLDALSGIDLGSQGEKFGKALKAGADTLIGLFKNGTFAEALKLSLTIGAKEFANVMAANIAAFVSSLAHVAALGIRKAIDVFIQTNPVLRLISKATGFKAAGEDETFSVAFQEGLDKFKDLKIFGDNEEIERLGKIMIDAKEAGEDFVKSAEINNSFLPKLNPKFREDDDPSKSDLSKQEKDNKFSVIADSLAEVGGGGGFAQSIGQPLLEQSRKIEKAIEKGNTVLQKIETALGSTEKGLILA